MTQARLMKLYNHGTSLQILSDLNKAQAVSFQSDSFRACLQYVRSRYKERMAHSNRTLIVPITALRRSLGSYPFKLIELINQLNLAQFSFCSHRVVRGATSVQTVEYRGLLQSGPVRDTCHRRALIIRKHCLLILSD